MADPINLDLGTIDIGAGGTTAAQKICFNYGWSISTEVLGTSGTATYTLEVSHDNINWKDYKLGSTNIAIDDAIQDINMAWTWLRIVAVIGGASAGNVNFTMQLKSR